jgi:hypothetical protein
MIINFFRNECIMVSGFATLEYKFKQNQMGKFIKINESDICPPEKRGRGGERERERERET